MAWNPINAFNIPVGRNDAILVSPNLLYTSHCSILVQDVRRRNWRKSGDLYQQFLGDMRSPPLFVPMAEKLALPMVTELGGYYLRFQPVAYHKGLFVQIWEWVEFAIRINCGGDAYIDSLGRIWLADSFFQWGVSYFYPSLGLPQISAPASFPLEVDLYDSERGSQSFNYSIPAENGEYSITLYLCEPSLEAVGERIFNVSLQGNLALENLDVFALVGKSVGIKRTFNVDVSTGFIQIDFEGVANNAQINAIEIVRS